MFGLNSPEARGFKKMQVAMKFYACLAIGLVCAVTVQAQIPAGGRGDPFRMGEEVGRRSFFRVAANDAVHKDLGLTEAEITRVKAVTDEYGAAARKSFSAGGVNFNRQNMTDEERRAAIVKRMDAADALAETLLPKLKEAVTQDQFTRLQQINWQTVGVAAYGEAEIVKALTITKKQMDNINALTDEYRSKAGEPFQRRVNGDDRGFKKLMELNKERDAKINEILTKAQLDTFAKLKGEEFDVTQLRRGLGSAGNGAGTHPN
jgi:Spy/CpxP family protein refolding chaperone